MANQSVYSRIMQEGTSVEKLQSLLAEQIPGWATERIGDIDDPENVRTQATVLDSLLRAHGAPPNLNILSKEDLSPLMYPFDKPRAHYNAPPHPENIEDIDKLPLWFRKVVEEQPPTGRINASTLGDIIAELAHDIQYKDPQYKAARGEKHKYVDAGDATYSDVPYKTEGALEHEAHSEIQPILEGLLTNILSKKGMSLNNPMPSNLQERFGVKRGEEWFATGWGLKMEDYEDNPLIKDGQNQSQTIRPASSVHDVGKVY